MKPAYLLQRKCDLPRGVEWLAPNEAARLADLRFPKRREDWLLGRWTAKSLLTQLAPQANTRLADWEIGTAADGAPEVRYREKLSGIPLSLSHRAGCCLCAIADFGWSVGCDLERVEPRGPVFEETWFTAQEIGWLNRAPADARNTLATLIWSAKESALKVLRLGLRADTRRIGVRPCRRDPADAWQPLEVEDATDGRIFHGWWREMAGMVCTLLADRVTGAPWPLGGRIDQTPVDA